MVAKFFNILSRAFLKFQPKQVVDNSAVANHVADTLEEYRDTIKYLELYDKGQVAKPREVARYRSLRNYLQNI